jgi:hypothetical protein
MSKHKDSKKQKKGSQLVLRVDKAERDTFVSLCEALDTSAARGSVRANRERASRGWRVGHRGRCLCARGRRNLGGSKKAKAATQC